MNATQRSALLVIALVTFLMARPVSAQDWTKFISDRWVWEFQPMAVQPTGDGLVVAGTNGYNLELARFDRSGELIWHRSYNDPRGRITLIAMQQSREGGMLVSGYLELSPENIAALTYHIDDHGDVVWKKVIDGPHTDHAHAVIERRTGGYFVAGHTEPADDGTEAMWLVALDDDRKILWQKSYVRGDYSHVHTALESDDGGCVLVGHTMSGHHGDMHYWIMKVAPDGAEQWSHEFPSSDSVHEEPYAAVRTKDGAYAIFGTSYDAAKKLWTIRLLVVTSGGDVRVDEHFGMVGGQFILSDGRQTTDGGFVITGTFVSDTRSEPRVYAVVIRTDDAGRLLWERRFNQGVPGIGTGTIELGNSYLLVTRVYSSLGFVNIDKQGTTGSSDPRPAAWCFPNPARSGDVVTIDIGGSAPADAELTIHDDLGRYVTTLKGIAPGRTKHRYEWRPGSGEARSSGVYIYSLQGETGRVTGKVVVLAE